MLILSNYGTSVIPEVQQLQQTLASGSYSRLVGTAMQPDGSTFASRSGTPSHMQGNIPTTQPFSAPSQSPIPTTQPFSESHHNIAPGSHMSANSFSYSNPYGANLSAPDMTATNLPQEEHSASDTDATSSGSDSGSDDNGSSSSSSKKVVRYERGNREKTLIKLTSTYDTTVLQEGFEESRLTRNLGGKSTKEMVIHAKDLTILSEKQLSKTINDNFRSNPTNSAEYAQLQGIPAFNVPRLLRMFFTVGFKFFHLFIFHKFTLLTILNLVNK